MLNSDHEKGKALLIVTSAIFLYYTIWVIGLPFIDDNRLRSLFFSNNTAIMIPAISGFCLIGGLMLFTVYHVKPYINNQKVPERKISKDKLQSVKKLN